MAEEEVKTFEVTHQRVTKLDMTQGEVETLIVAEAIRRATTNGIVIDLGKGKDTEADVHWKECGGVIVTFTEDIPVEAAP